MKKIIKKLGGSTGITFSKDELKINNIIVGDFVDVEICKIKEDDKNENN